MLKECSFESCSCPPLYADVGEYCVPNNEASNLGTESSPESSSKSQMKFFLTKTTSITQICLQFRVQKLTLAMLMLSAYLWPHNKNIYVNALQVMKEMDTSVHILVSIYTVYTFLTYLCN